MLTNPHIKKLIDFWKSGADDNYGTMLSLYKNKRYSACLFFGHLTLEKVLKILVIRKTKDFPPFTHNLSRLAEMAQLDLDEQDKDFLATVNTFNIEGRYPEEQYDFYKLCTKKFSDPYVMHIKMLYKNLCEKVK